MTKIEMVRSLPTSSELQQTARDLQCLPQAILDQLAPISLEIDQALSAQRLTIETLLQQAVQQIEVSQARSLQSIQASQATLSKSAASLAAQAVSLQSLPDKTQAAAAQAERAAMDMRQAVDRLPPTLTVASVLTLSFVSALAAAAIVLAGIFAFVEPAQNASAQMQTQMRDGLTLERVWPRLDASERRRLTTLAR
jgi:ParB-like chromosome segregation protein Spo0J